MIREFTRWRNQTVISCLCFISTSNLASSYSWCLYCSNIVIISSPLRWDSQHIEVMCFSFIGCVQLLHFILINIKVQPQSPPHLSQKPQGTFWNVSNAKLPLLADKIRSWKCTFMLYFSMNDWHYNPCIYVNFLASVPACQFSSRSLTINEWILKRSFSAIRHLLWV